MQVTYVEVMLHSSEDFCRARTVSRGAICQSDPASVRDAVGFCWRRLADDFYGKEFRVIPALAEDTDHPT